ncbi:hypothetical protein DWW31_12130 [Clostridium sp. AF15-17LB]|nr:hypothetical protein DWW31_12130 [Clostridium sp. AF15-17LB]
MKRAAALSITIAMFMSMSATALAAGETIVDQSSTQTGSTEVQYGVEKKYTVTIPADFNITAAPTSQTVKAESVIIEHGKTLNIKISSNNYKASSWYMKDEKDVSNELPYTISMNSSEVKSNDPVLSVAAGTDKGQTELAFSVDTKDVTKAGTYKDTLTFEVSVDDTQP